MIFQHTDQTLLQFPDLGCRNDSFAPSLQKVVDEVADYFAINACALRGRRIASTLRVPRQMAMYLCVQMTQVSFREVGAVFGDRNAATVRYHCLCTQRAITENSFTNAVVKNISREIVRNAKDKCS